MGRRASRSTSTLFTRARKATSSAWPRFFRRLSHVCAERLRVSRSLGTRKQSTTGLNFTLTTTLGDIDLFGEVAGGGSYSDLLQHAGDVEAFDLCFKCIDLPTLIRIKEAAGRPKDREAIAELRVLLQETEQRQS
jgi:predicted nucleotidyltransferase